MNDRLKPLKKNNFVVIFLALVQLNPIKSHQIPLNPIKFPLIPIKLPLIPIKSH
jgi:hypothetical protein